jgi:hypothetical protein
LRVNFVQQRTLARLVDKLSYWLIHLERKRMNFHMIEPVFWIFLSLSFLYLSKQIGNQLNACA